jgi:FHA domain
MSRPAGMLTGHRATDDLDSSMGTDTETTMVPVIVGYSDSARGMRLRLRFDDRELLVDERASSITIGRAEVNDVVVKGHLSSRLHARIVIGRSNFVLIDQSTNGTFVKTSDGEELFMRQDILQLKGQGMIGLGCVPQQGSQHTIHFTCEEIY